MKRLYSILPVLLLVFSGCQSHRTTVTHEVVDEHRAVVDSTVSRADTVRRADSASVSWSHQAVVLEWDSVDYRFVLDSAGRVSGVSGKRVLSRRSGTAAASSIASTQAVSHAVESTSTVVSDSVRHELSQEKTVETKADVSRPLHWLEWLSIAIMLALAVGGVIHLRELTDRWSKR